MSLGNGIRRDSVLGFQDSCILRDFISWVAWCWPHKEYNLCASLVMPLDDENYAPSYWFAYQGFKHGPSDHDTWLGQPSRKDPQLTHEQYAPSLSVRKGRGTKGSKYVVDTPTPAQHSVMRLIEFLNCRASMEMPRSNPVESPSMEVIHRFKGSQSLHPRQTCAEFYVPSVVLQLCGFLWLPVGAEASGYMYVCFVQVYGVDIYLRCSGSDIFKVFVPGHLQGVCALTYLRCSCPDISKVFVPWHI